MDRYWNAIMVAIPLKYLPHLYQHLYHNEHQMKRITESITTTAITGVKKSPTATTMITATTI